MIRTCISILIILVASQVAVAQQPRACIAGDQKAGIPFLPDNDPKIIVRSVDLDDPATQNSYKIKTYSESDPSGQSRSEQCFRYEVENTGQGNIRNFFWALSGIDVDPLKPNLRRSKKRKQQILDNPIDIDSRVNAFDNSEALTRAWADRVTGDTVAQGGSSGVEFARMSPSSVDPRLQAFLSANNLPANSIFAYFLTTPDPK